MQVNVRELQGNWDRGYALDVHVLNSRYIGDNEYGRPQFDTTRSEAGEALFQLKYRNDHTQAALIAAELNKSIVPLLVKPSLIIPMPSSTVRAVQPVDQIGRELAAITKLPMFDKILVKTPGNAQLKDLGNKHEKLQALQGRFSINDAITSNGRWNAILLDDLFDTGASMEVACATLRTYHKIANIYAVAVTWK